MKEVLIGLGVAVAPMIVTMLLPRKKTRALGRKIGRLVSKFLRIKLGKGENAVETTLIDFFDGFEEGLREDNVNNGGNTTENTGTTTPRI